MHGFYRGGFALLLNDKSQTPNLPLSRRSSRLSSVARHASACSATWRAFFRPKLGTVIAFTTAKTKQRCKKRFNLKPSCIFRFKF